MDRKNIKQLGRLIRLPVLVLVRTLRVLLGRMTTVRRVVFDTNIDTAFFAVNTSKEHLLVSADDPTIGRHVFVRREAFDFGKLELVAKLLPKAHDKSLLVDIGANIGTICVPAVKRGYFKTAVAIEPGPLNFSILMANIYLNGLSGKISAHQYAAGTGEESKLRFELSEQNHGDHRIRGIEVTAETEEHNRATIEVEVAAVDHLVRHGKADTTLI